MKPLEALQSLKPLKEIQSIKALKKEPLERFKTPLSEVELILYSTNICYHSMKILRGETIVQNRNAKLNAMMQEATKISSLLSKRDFYLYSTYTKSDTKKFFRDVGIRAKHLKTT